MFPLYYTLYPKKMEKRKVTRSTAAQIKFLIDYMSTHVDFANNDGEFASPLNSKKKQAEWKKLANLLRQHGPDKTIDQWQHSWRDLKKKAREEVKRVQTENTAQVPEIAHRHIKILNTIGFDNISVVQDETENDESRDSNEDESNKGNTADDGKISIEFVELDDKKSKKRIAVKRDLDAENNDSDNNSERDQSEHDFEHSFHLKPKRSRTPVATPSIDPGEASEDQSESDEYGTFGVLIAQKIRKLNYRHRLVAQQRIIQILFDMQMEELKR